MNSLSVPDNAWTVGAQPAATQPSLRLPLLLQYWNALWRHRILVLIILAVVLMAAAVLTVLATPEYTASTDVEISRERDRVTNVDSLESDRAGQSQEFYYTQYELLKARSLAERVVRAEGLARSEAFFAAHGMSADEDASTDGPKGAMAATDMRAREKRAVAILQSHIEVTPLRGSALATISYTSDDPVWSARLANAWAEQFIEASLARRYASTTEARRFLESRLADLRGKLDTSERALVDYAVQRNLVKVQGGQAGETDTAQTLTELDLAALNRRLSEATAERIDAQAKASALANQRENTRTVDSASLNALAEKRAALSSDLAGMLVQFEPEYPPARALQQQISAIDRAIATERGRLGRASNADLDAARLREASLRQQVNALASTLISEERNGIQLGILQREVDTNRTLYEGLLQRYKEIGVAGVGSSNIAIVDPATVPTAPSSPNLLINLLLAALLGIALAATAVIVLENLDQGIRDPSNAQAMFGIPLLGVIPDTKNEDPREAIVDRKSAVSEAYSTVQTNLAFSTDHGMPKVLMLTSTAKAEGKSTSALALAISIARMGRRVILVDADMRLPTLDELLNRRGAPGLSNYLAGDDEIARLLYETNHEGVTALPSGPVPPSAPELLGGDRLPKLVAELRQRFDTVIIDSPPMLGLADALLVSRVVEGVAFVAEAERGAVRNIAAAIERLRAGGARIFGLIVTKYSSDRSGYGYGYGYATSYTYGGGSQTGARDDKAIDRED